MTARERIQKGIRDHDAAIEKAREEIDATAGGPAAFVSPDDAYASAKTIMRQAGIILSRLAQRREAVANLKLLDYHVSKHPGATETFGI